MLHLDEDVLPRVDRIPIDPNDHLPEDDVAIRSILHSRPYSGLASGASWLYVQNQRALDPELLQDVHHARRVAQLLR